MTEARCPKCSGDMSPRQNKNKEWFFVCLRYPECRGVTNIYFGRPDPFYAVANGLGVLAGSVERLVEALTAEDRSEAAGESVQHVQRVDRCLADYWKGRA